MSGSEPQDAGPSPTEWVEPHVGRNMHDFRQVMRRIIPSLKPHETVTAVFKISSFRHQLDFVALTDSRVLAGSSSGSASSAIHVRLEAGAIASLDIDKKRRTTIHLRSGESVDLGKLLAETDRFELTRLLKELIGESEVIPVTDDQASDRSAAPGVVSPKLDHLERIANLLASGIITREQAEKLRDELLEE
jgi:hypothetical protein